MIILLQLAEVLHGVSGATAQSAGQAWGFHGKNSAKERSMRL
jgi:hypothetical protein